MTGVPKLLRAVTVPHDVHALLPAVAEMISGRGDAVLPVPEGDDRQIALLTSALRAGEPVDDDIALVIPTSGSTGVPKGAMLTAAALVASASATHARLGGPGQWLSALPAYHIAGLEVLVRSVLAGLTPVALDVLAGFDVALLPDAVAAMTGPRRYTALVAAQLWKALTDPAATAALASLDAVLVGGGPLPPRLAEEASAAGIPFVHTYGMTETAGGCVYNGVPLPGVEVLIDDPDPASGIGRIVLGGSTVAKGYRNPVATGTFPGSLRSHPPNPFRSGRFHADDSGSIDANGVLTVHGRLDQAISTGGLTVIPQIVETVLVRHPAIVECAVFGVPDERLGQRVVAALVVVGDPPSVGDLRTLVAASLDPTAAPREVHVVDALPVHGIGKIDRRALTERFGS